MNGSKHYSLIFLLMLLFFFLILPDNIKAAEQTAVQKALREWFQTETPYHLQDLMIDFHSGELLQNYYQERDYKPGWVNDTGAKNLAGQFVEKLKSSEEEGLFPHEYNLPVIEDLIEDGHKEINSLETLTAVELLLTDSFFIYISDLINGRINKEKGERVWVQETENLDLIKLLQQITRHEDLSYLQAEVSRISPRQPQYEMLKEKLAELREVRDSDQYSISDLIREENEDLVPSFQQMIDKIIINMERLRWINQDPTKTHIIVNVPEFRLGFYRGGKVVREERVIVGTRNRETPFLSTAITGLVFNPRWYIPHSIAVKDFLPEIKEDIDYLDKKNVRVYERDGNKFEEKEPESINWKEIDEDDFDYYLWQDSGPWNALGDVIFQSPNSEHIFIHDTPDKSLFDHKIRTYSSGCVRVNNALKLAEYVVDDYTVKTVADMERVLANKKEVTLHLTERIPLHFVYFTLKVDRNEKLRILPDIYQRDPELKELYFKAQYKEDGVIFE